jgi:hypothetical protein
MTISVKLRRLVTKRAGFACEYCGVADVDAGGELTIDHFQPSAQGGSDDESNLLYACLRCNLFKADYWPSSPNRPQLWNPRSSPRGDHLLELADGTLFPITDIGAFTLRRLRLNRPQLVAYRIRRSKALVAGRLVSDCETLLKSVGELQQQLAEMHIEQRRLLRQQRRIMRLLAEIRGER